MIGFLVGYLIASAIITIVAAGTFFYRGGGWGSYNDIDNAKMALLAHKIAWTSLFWPGWVIFGIFKVLAYFSKEYRETLKDLKEQVNK